MKRFKMKQFKTFLKWTGLFIAGGAVAGAVGGFFLGAVPGAIPGGLLGLFCAGTTESIKMGGMITGILAGAPIGLALGIAGAALGGIAGILSSPLLFNKNIRNNVNSAWKNFWEEMKKNQEEEPLLAASPDNTSNPLPGPTIDTAPISNETHTNPTSPNIQPSPALSAPLPQPSLS